MAQKYYYHISTKGTKTDLFKDPEDYRQIIIIIALVFCGDSDSEIVCFSIMSNHIHMVVYGVLESIDRSLVSVKKRYSMWYSRKYGANKIFNGVQCSIRKCEDYEDVKNCIGYDYYNPVKAGLTNNPYYYPWSSISAHFREESYPMTSHDHELSPRAQRKVFHTRQIMPEGIKLMENGCPDPLTVINPDHVNRIMKTARSLHYFIFKNRDGSGDNKEAAFLSNDTTVREKAKELAKSICGREVSPESLPGEIKKNISEQLKYSFGVPAKVISRVLGLE